MQFHRSLDTVITSDSWLTIGSFDGVHLGHQSIIRRLVDDAHAAGLPAVVLTFEPHPLKVLRPEFTLLQLTSNDERAALLAELGVDHVVAMPFDLEVAALSASDFLLRVRHALGFSRLLIGYDFALGRNREGNAARLEELGRELGYALQVFEPIRNGGAIYSSSRIRRMIAEGDLRTAAEMLGRPYSVTGTVVPGAQRGRTIGIPTANISVAGGRAIPQTGVYACRVTVRGRTYDAATNIGVRPTFEAGIVDETVEAHILDFDQNIYNETVQVSFVEKLRGEKKFAGVDALIAQIRSDIVLAREVLRETVS